MKVSGKKGLASILKIILEVGFVIGIIILIGMPFLLYLIKVNFDLFYLLLYPGGIVFLLIVYEFIKMFNLLKADDCFNNSIIKSINIASVSSFGISVITVIEILICLFLYDKSASFIAFLVFISILFFGVAIALYLLKEIFLKAITYKEEIDLTI